MSYLEYVEGVQYLRDEKRRYAFDGHINDRFAILDELELVLMLLGDASAELVMDFLKWQRHIEDYRSE